MYAAPDAAPHATTPESEAVNLAPFDGTATEALQIRRVPTPSGLQTLPRTGPHHTYSAAYPTLVRFVEALVDADQASPSPSELGSRAVPSTIGKVAYLRAHMAMSAALLPRYDAAICERLALDECAAITSNDEASSVAVAAYVCSLIELGEMWTDQLRGSDSTAEDVGAFLTRLLHHITWQEPLGGDAERRTFAPVQTRYSADAAVASELRANQELAVRLDAQATARGRVRYRFAQPQQISPIFASASQPALTRPAPDYASQ